MVSDRTHVDKEHRWRFYRGILKASTSATNCKAYSWLEMVPAVHKSLGTKVMIPCLSLTGHECRTAAAPFSFYTRRTMLQVSSKVSFFVPLPAMMPDPAISSSMTVDFCIYSLSPPTVAGIPVALRNGRESKQQTFRPFYKTRNLQVARTIALGRNEESNVQAIWYGVTLGRNKAM
nr:hypothetical protein CFP56_26069 [Quercus suber]